ncbi:hypothetical protein G7Y89_g9177 [Cudoniella acicularis]|uniref:Uncharacterized protein n=1 Tax=Cudoniella acicularis TaxID=354080 RepID=A0A8H4W0C5_9HELO|nr:hypothetical protein G7Y89_g9177 [Cudoniella acicularis]
MLHRPRRPRIKSLRYRARELKKKPPPKTLSDEFVHDNDDEDEEKASDEESSSENESLPSNPADTPLDPNGRLPAPEGSSSSSEDDSDSDEQGEEESEEESSDDEPQKPIETALKASKSKEVTQEPASTPITPKKPTEYKPPAGFEAASIANGTQVAGAFKKSRLEGKQIWYITAPASVPISSLKEMSLLGAKAGEVICLHKGNYYGFVQDAAADSSSTKVMVPNAESGYKTVTKPIDEVFRLQQIVNLPGVHDSATPSSSKATIPEKKPVRPQPKGLKMRYVPVGFSNSKPGIIGSSSSDEASSDESDSDEEMKDVIKEFQRPGSIESSDKDSTSGSDEDMTEAPPLPSKKVSSKQEKPSRKATSNGSLKRKHNDGIEKEMKNSSSRSAVTIDGKQLKRLKIKQTESQRNMAERLSRSAKAPTATSPILHPESSQISSSLEASKIAHKKSKDSIAGISPHKKGTATETKHSKSKPSGKPIKF